MINDSEFKYFLISIYSALILGKENFSEHKNQQDSDDFSLFNDFSQQQIELFQKANLKHLKNLAQVQSSLKTMSNVVNAVLEFLPKLQDLNFKGILSMEVPEETEDTAVTEVTDVEEVPVALVEEEVVKEVESLPPTPLSAQDSAEDRTVGFSQLHENMWKLDYCARLYEKLTVKQTNSFALMRALTTMDFDGFRESFRSTNLFHVWLNVILRTEVLCCPGNWLKRFMQDSARMTKNCWDALRKCMNVHVLRCCVDIGVALNIDQRNKAAKLGLLV